ncbi:glycerol uptake facilitator protein [Methanococcus maripaludis]|uniref:Glycerol uptake facilitator protein n=1 Tax=Methanococcus maripaludis TaxID=39152 RepID=A0A7J9S4H1_METMI|nr:MIP/aquaporin family protein [Methanococcus maripaludis]MBA2840260.1 glycerol uptake facilitator protein [Methanococcus maripaludis]MBA2852867.1 glycerol uptake facilitator protein [Methanococcus maripaludis]MBA2859972.1 glycerol uptake facilitator protein [Methanococcus maripaludis]MBA2868613.1 glycerol uptake facilitator protein [Methanococcus maripaludis]MBB6400783.1 glycerol uptake facilitator protein [Methanococcus maripaludis]
MSMLKKLIAECLGTGILVFFGPGAAAMTLMIANNTGTAGIGLLGGLGDWFAIGFSFAIAIAAVIYTMGRISGAHINPAVTIGLWAVKKFPTTDAVLYIIAQLIGAAIGSLLFFACIGIDSVTVGGLGATAPFAGISYFQAILAEFIGTFLLMFVIMGVAVDKRAPDGFAGLVIGLTVGAIITTTGNIAGASLNPARTFGPYLIDSIYGLNLWYYFPIYIIGPVLGAIVAAFTYEYLNRE